MTLFRPQQMVWVDLLIDRESAQQAVHLLATRHIIELRTYPRTDQPVEIHDQTVLLQRLEALRERLDRYRRYLPDLAGIAHQPEPLQPTAEAPQVTSVTR